MSDQLVRRDSAGGWSCPDWSRWELVSTGQQWMLEQTLASLLEILLEMVMTRVSINTEELVVISILSRWWLSLSTHVDTRHCLRSVISGQEMARPDTRTVPRLWLADQLWSDSCRANIAAVDCDLQSIHSQSYPDYERHLVQFMPLSVIYGWGEIKKTLVVFRNKDIRI